MLRKSVFQSMLLSLLILFSVAAFAAADPTIQQVYDMANAGRLDEAQAAMQKVLQDHPNSAKAHFVEAELLGKQGRYASAEAELNNADRLEPGLPFAKPGSVEDLRRLIANAKQHPGAMRPAPAGVSGGYSAPANSGPPWGLILVGLGLIGFIVFAVKFMSSRNQPVYMQNGMPNGMSGVSGYGPGMPGQPYGGMPGQMMGGTGGGIGSGIVGGLVTGAALGAGMVAGEELMHHFTDGDRPRNYPGPSSDDYVAPPDNMGGNDFGINDTSSWDSGGGGGDSGGGDW